MMFRASVLLVAALILLALGGAATVGSVLLQVDRRYAVAAQAPDGLTWTLWLPSPSTAEGPVIDGSMNVGGNVETSHGSLLNATGSGSAQFDFQSSTYAFGGDPYLLSRGFDLTGLEGTGANRTFAIWRASSNSAANLSVYGTVTGGAGNLDVSTRCGGPGFNGALIEGWNFLPVLIGDCVTLVTAFPGMFAILFFLAGGIVWGVAGRRRDRMPG
jgi:hypothetical protein